MINSNFDQLPEDILLLVNNLCNRFEAAWQTDAKPSVESFLGEISEQHRLSVVMELLPIEVEYRIQSGEEIQLEACQNRFPNLPQDWLAHLLQDAPDKVPKQFGDYEIIEPIGQGGMGTVYKAVHQRMERTVALKVLRGKLSSEPQWIRRFEREVHVAAKLSHPNIVRAFDARMEDGVYCLITEYIAGSDLSTLIAESGPLPVLEAVECVLQTACGLAYAHDQGVIHRDVKPANLLLDDEGIVKILDMGLARLEEPDSGPQQSELTATGTVMGTAAYMSPEQARNTKNADARSDIYSLGCTLFYLLTGRPTYAGETMVETILAHANQAVPSLQDTVEEQIPEQLEIAFQRMVAKEPADRYASMSAVVAVLEAVTQNLQDASSSAEFGSAITEPHRHNDTTFIKGNEHHPQQEKETVLDVPKKRTPLPISSPVFFALAVFVLIFVYLVPLFKTADPPALASQTSKVSALAFDGESSYVVVPTLKLNPTDKITLEATVRLRESQTSNVISWLGPNMMALFLNGNGRWGIARIENGVSYLIISRELAELDQTVHLAGTWDGRSLKLFIDGIPVETNPIKGFQLPTTGSGLYIGGVPLDILPQDQNYRFFAGEISNVRIFRDVRYTERFEPQAELTPDENTMASFPFSEGSGKTTSNEADRDRPGEVVNTKWTEIQNSPAVKTKK